ncbi:unnamed protein product [Echinostoma caproni]|uniref:Uncharacterized protein n=1 Tax=Echinostoma caproni TaxID=27848 RepID=A0A3P8CRI8_9TREM|nr:unnamed protein product [Echinostoma caproni]
MLLSVRFGTSTIAFRSGGFCDTMYRLNGCVSQCERARSDRHPQPVQCHLSRGFFTALGRTVANSLSNKLDGRSRD